jgi:hypothetical protein
MSNSSHQRHGSEEPSSGNASQGGDEVLGTLSGGSKNAPATGQGSTPSVPATPAPTENPMGDLGGLLGSILGGVEGNSTQGGTSAGGDLGGLLGSILGGGSSNTGAQNSNDPLGGLLGGLFGGGGQANMGAMGNASGLTSMLEPFADKLADKIGIPRETAMAVLTVVAPMVINKIMSSGQGTGSPLGTSMQREGLSFTPEEKHEMAKQIASQTGLDHHAATNTLNQAIQVLSSQ